MVKIKVDSTLLSWFLVVFECQLFLLHLISVPKDGNSSDTSMASINGRLISLTFKIVFDCWNANLRFGSSFGNETLHYLIYLNKIIKKREVKKILSLI